MLPLSSSYTNGALADSIRAELSRRDDSFAVPHLLDVEVLGALRRLAAGQQIDSHWGGQFLARLAALPAMRYPHTPLANQTWELRRKFTAYDATYIALAEASGVILCTCDEKLRNGHRAQILLLTK